MLTLNNYEHIDFVRMFRSERLSVHPEDVIVCLCVRASTCMRVSVWQAHSWVRSCLPTPRLL